MKEKEFFNLLSKRRSIRNYQDKSLDESVLSKILSACDMAPSSGGLQTFEIYQIKSRPTKEKLALAAMDQMFIADAPLILVFCANPSRSVERFGKRSELFSVQDATIATAYAQLTAYALDLTTVWIGAFDEEKVSKILKIPHGQRPVSILPIGYPAEDPKEKTTRGSNTLLHVIQ